MITVAPPGALYLQRPLRNLAWVVGRRARLSVLDAVALVVQCLCCLFYPRQESNVLQYIGDDEFTHTRSGHVQVDKADRFPPGLLETCDVLVPTGRLKWSPEHRRAFLDLSHDRVPLSFVDFLLTPLHRWRLPAVPFEKMVFVSPRLANSCHMVAVGWFRAGIYRREMQADSDSAEAEEKSPKPAIVDLGVEMDRHPSGMYPADFRACTSCFQPFRKLED